MRSRHGSSIAATLLLLATACGGAAANQAESANANAGASAQRAGRQVARRDRSGDQGDRGCSTEPVYFSLDSSDIGQGESSKLERSARCMRDRHSEEALIVGSADPRGTEEYNMALGERRAHAAGDYLKMLGVPRVQVQSTGEELAEGSDEAGWARDRRATIEPK